LTNNIHIDAHSFAKEFIEELRRIDDDRVRSYLGLIDALGYMMLQQ
jgi:hypothetical protein